MKKAILIFFLIIFLGGTSAFSQQKPFVFGFKAGSNLGWMNPDSKGYSSDGLKLGFSWGFVADFVLMDNYSIVTGFDVLFLNSGLKIPASMNSNSGVLVRKYKLKYVQIPVSLKMRTNDLGKFRIYGQIGLGSSFLIGAKADDEFTPDNMDEFTSEKVDVYDDISFMRESLILGAGVEFGLGGSTSATAGLVYNNGFMDILKGKNTIDPTINNKAKLNFLALEIGIVF